MSNTMEFVLTVIVVFVVIMGILWIVLPHCNVKEGGAMQIESARVEWDSYECDEHTGLVKLCGVHISLHNKPGIDKEAWYAPIACEAIESRR